MEQEKQLEQEIIDNRSSKAVYAVGEIVDMDAGGFDLLTKIGALSIPYENAQDHFNVGQKVSVTVDDNLNVKVKPKREIER